jgi:hypothetical protein
MGDGNIDDLLAKQEITDVIYRYCRAMDRMDRPLAMTIWHPDGTAFYEDFFEGTGAEFIDAVWKVHEERFVSHSHQVTNILIEVDGDRATSESYLTVALRAKPEDSHSEVQARGRYVDRWSRRDGRWAIDHRVYVHDMSDVRTINPPYLTGHLCQRGPADLSYRQLGAGWLVEQPAR